jgi:hypothetical protein
MHCYQFMRLTAIVVFALTLTSIGMAQGQRPSTPLGPRGTSGTTLDLPLRITGTAISAGGFRNPTGVARVEIDLNRLSSPDQRSEFLQRLKTDGQDALLEALRKASSVGTIRFDTNLAWDLRYAMMRPGPANPVQLFLATDRPMSITEVWNQPQYSDYPFTLINLELGADLKGKGTMILAARITGEETGRFVHVENYGSQPVQLNDLRAEVAH